MGVKQGTESEQIVPSQEESPKEQEQEETVQDEVKEVEQEDKLEEKPEPTIADDKDSEPESMGCCGLRRPRKSAAKPEEQKQDQEEKVTCCGMKKSSPNVDEELEVMEATEQTLQPQKLEPIKEESTTGSEQLKPVFEITHWLKRDSIPESQEVK